MYKTLQRFLWWSLTACLPLVIAACSGGSNTGGTEPTTMISGIAVKGPIQGALVQVFRLLPDGRTGELLGSGISAVTGRYGIQIPSVRASGPLLIKVTGQAGASYSSESTGGVVNFTPGESFNAVIEAYSPGQDITVSPLTEAAYQKLQQILTTDPSQANAALIGGAIAAANNRIASLFGTGSILADPANDLSYRAALLCIDRMIVDGGSPANTVTVMNSVNQAFADITSPAYQTYLQALTAAANRLKPANSGNLAMLAALDAIITRSGSPAVEPDWTDLIAPTAPANLTATTITPQNANTGSIVLSWNSSTDNKAVTGYDIYRNDIKIATVTSPGHTDLALATNTTYKYYVFAFDAVGNRSVASNQLFVPLGLAITDTTPPTVPANLSASTFLTDTTAAVVLSWSPSTDNKAVAGYEVYRNNILIATVATPGYTDPQVTLTSTYQYSIIAFDGAGNRSVASNQFPVTPDRPSLGVTVNGQLSPGIIGLPQIDLIAPTAPANLSAATFAQTATTSSVVLSWNKSSDNTAVTGYEVYRNGSKLATVALPGFTDQPVISNTPYNYFVIAFDAAGNRSIASNQLLVTSNQASLGVTVNGQLSTGIIGLPQQDITAPTAPSNLTAVTAAVSATTSAVALAWSPSTDNTAVTGYEIYRNGSKIGTVTSLVFTDPAVTSNTTYIYYIIAFDAAGNRSLASNQLPVTPDQTSLGVTINGQLSTGLIGLPQQDITAPTAPSNLTAVTSSLTATTSSVLLAWSPSSDNTAVTGYEVYRNNTLVSTVLTPAYTDPSVTSGTYTYSVKAFDAAGNRSASSSQLLVTTTAAALGVTFSGQLSSTILGF